LTLGGLPANISLQPVIKPEISLRIEALKSENLNSPARSAATPHLIDTGHDTVLNNSTVNSFPESQNGRGSMTRQDGIGVTCFVLVVEF